MLRSTANIDIDKSLDALCLSGIQSAEGIETTSAFHSIGTDQLEAAVDNFLGHETSGDAIHGFDIACIVDAKQVQFTDVFCWGCHGAGHTRLLCPSPNVPRSLESVRALIDVAIERQTRLGHGGAARL